MVAGVLRGVPSTVPGPGWTPREGVTAAVLCWALAEGRERRTQRLPRCQADSGAVSKSPSCAEDISVSPEIRRLPGAELRLSSSCFLLSLLGSLGLSIGCASVVTGHVRSAGSIE